MVSRVRTINFLPDIFKTKANEQFLSATLDQLVSQPNTMKVQGYIGSKFGYGINAKDGYVVEPTKVRTDYQLEPSVVFLKKNTATAVDLLTYPGLIDALKLEGGITDQHDNLFSNQFYSWDSFTDLDKLINYNQYYWLPLGPELVTVSTNDVYSQTEFTVVPNGNYINFSADNLIVPGNNPTISLLRGGTYQFVVNQSSQFWIQGTPGLKGTDPVHTNIGTRNIYGLTNNGTSSGVMTFQVPFQSDQSYAFYPSTQSVDLLTTKSWDEINGMRVRDLGNIDGVVSLDGRTIVFYGNSPTAQGYIGEFYDEFSFDEDNPVVKPYEDGYYTDLNKNIYRISYVGDPDDPVIRVTEHATIVQLDRIKVLYGDEFAFNEVYTDALANMYIVPYLSALADTLYYQDGSNVDRVGVIKIIDAISNNQLNVNTQILGKKTFTSPNGVQFTNGLKVTFAGNIYPESYFGNEYYVEGVGTAITLLPVTNFIVPEPAGQAYYNPYSVSPYDTEAYDSASNVPLAKDYITISRNSYDRNAWSRSNRWFHVDVLRATAQYRGNEAPVVLEALNNSNFRAKRPIIEFYPNLKLYNQGSVSKGSVDFVDSVVTDPFGYDGSTPICSGATTFYPNSGTSAIPGGVKIVFTAAEDINVRNKVYLVTYSNITGSPTATPVITLTVAADGDVSANDQVVVTAGDYIGQTYHFNGTDWISGQFKERVNQAPLFDVFSSSGISFSDQEYYLGSSFRGCTLFEYALGTGSDDPQLGFPLKYSSLTNIGDITFNVTLNNQTFTYVEGSTPQSLSVDTGYVYKYIPTTATYARQLGWQTTVGESFQYQVFELIYNSGIPKFVCDVPYKDPESTPWPVTQVYVNNERLAPTAYTRTVDSQNSTIITLNTAPLPGAPVQVLIYSDIPSSVGYYEIPTNLQNNPFNTPVSNANLGDIRGHYKSICNNITTLVGAPFGANNYRDLGNLVPYGTRITQSSASLVPAAAFLRNQDFSIFNALTFNNNEYIKFKALLTDTINRTEYNRTYSDAYILDDALAQIAGTKDNSSAFFWSDMVPNGNKSASNSYTFVNFIKQSEFPLTRIYDFATANYYSVLLYVTRTTNGEVHTTQLLRGVDYDISTDAPKVIVYFDLLPNDVITIDEYSQTYGSFVPNTPSKMGLYPVSTPQVIYDTTYVTPTYFIKGHDGSLTKLYGEYTDGYLSDYRDRAYLEFEKRIFNNIKTSNVIPLTLPDIMPGEFRTTDYTYEEFQQIYSYGFLNWVGKNRIDYKTQYFDITNQYTYNYSQSINKSDYTPLKQGNWRGIYLWFYDTATPQSTPWEMLGFSEKPTWWETRYGVAPYTSDNLVLWNDLADGYVWNNGASYTIENRKRPGLLDVLPVDSSGNLVSPAISVVNAYDTNSINKNWKVGDVGPAEYGYLKSSSWPFDLMRMFALMKPAKFFALCIDVDSYEYNAEFNQYLENARLRSPLNDLPVYGNGTAVNSYVNWIVDYIQQLGMSGHDKVSDLVNNLDVRLAYRVAGFSDKDMLKFYVEKGSPNSKNNSLLIPDESYGVLLYNNQPFTKVVYSSVIIQKTINGYKVYGNSQNTAFFKTLVPKMNGNYDKYVVADVTIYVSKEYTDKTLIVPYGTEFYSVQALSEFLINYGRYLENDGMIFNNIENGIVENWEQMVAEAIYWTQSGWEAGSTVNVNPAATNLKINKESGIVQPLTFHQQNYVLNQNLIPIQVKDMSLIRNGTEFELNVLQNTDTFSYMTANISNYEHCIVFDNVTLFNDVIYNLVTGLRQERVLVKGVKSAEWNGQVDAQGFILNQDNIQEWQENIKYTKGVIVLYKNSYYTSTKIVQPSSTFNETEWVKTDYDSIQKGLLPNPSTRSYESLLYYDIHNTNLENDADLLSFSLIGYRPRDYLAVANLDDVTQVNVFINMIESMGTLGGANQLKNITVPQGQLGYDIYENWAIKTGEFGGVLNQNFIEFKLAENELTGNPGIIGVTNGIEVVEGVEQSVPLYSLTNYGRVLNNIAVLPTVDDISVKSLPDAGYVNFDDVKIHSYNFNGLYRANQPIEKLYNGDYIWLADYKGNWNVYTPVPLSTLTKQGIVLILVENNLTGTATLTFNKAHGLSKNDLIGVINFNEDIDGYYNVDKIISETSISITVTLQGATLKLRGSGVVFKLVTHRVDTPSDTTSLPILGQEFEKFKVWADQNSDGNWAVYERDDRYKYEDFNKPFFTTNFGSSAVYVPELGYLIGDTGEGKVYLYTYNPIAKQYLNTLEIDEGSNFGSSMETAGNIVVVAKTTSASSDIYVYSVVTEYGINQIIGQQVISLGGYCGYSMALSGDTDWLYISDNTNNKVYIYQLDADYTRTNTTYPLDGNVTAGSNTFVVNGNRTSTFVSGTKVSFSSADYSPVYTIISSKWDIVLNKTTITLGKEIQTNIITATATYIATTNYTSCGYIDLPDSSADDNFGSQVTTNHDGSMVFINSPNREYDGEYETWAPSTTYTAGTVLLNSGTYYKVLADAPGALTFSLIASYVSELKDIGYVYAFERLTQTYEQQYNALPLVPTLFTTIWSSSTLHPTPFLYLNGVKLIDGADYAIVTDTVTVDTQVNAGDIITVSSSEFVLKQVLSYYDTISDSQNNTEFGYGLDTNKYGNEVLGGSPYIINSDGQEGAVFRFTDGGKKYGMIIGTTNASLSSPTPILINGFEVTVSGTAAEIATTINNTHINNVVAYNSNGILVIGLRDVSLNPIGNKLSITVTDKTILEELGIAPYTKTQRIEEIYSGTRTQFGAAIRCNELSSFVVSAPVTTRRAITRFDYIDDNQNNDTIFDNDFTTFIDGFANAGAVYMYDYLPKYNENINNPGQYVFAQSCNDVTEDYGYEPNYGQALFFGGYRVLIGTPNFDSTAYNGRLVIYKNAENKADWSVHRSSSLVVDIDKLQGVQLYNNLDNTTLTSLDYIDPLQGKLLGAVRENIDVVSSSDPAGYNINNVSTNVVWGAGHVGTIWLDVSGMRFVNYHQNDVVYNSEYWGKVFTGSDVAVYSWIESTETPAFYTGTGTPYDLEKYASTVILDSAGNLIAKYYYWVRDTGIVFTKKGKTLADVILETYIEDPQGSGISYFAPYTPNVFGLYNAREYLNTTNTSIHIGFSTGTNDDVAHNEYQLIREGYAGDFLNGIPSAANSYSEPTSLYNRLLDSMAGLDEAGLLVPNPYLPKLLQRGISSRPSQSFFVDRFTALKNYLTYANEVMASFPIVESKSPTFLTKVGAVNPSNDLPFYDTSNVWEYVDWWAVGYDNNTKTAFDVPKYYNLAELNPVEGLLVGVETNSDGKREVYIYQNSTWNRIGLQDGTIQFKSILWDYGSNRLGFGNFFDTTPFDSFPSQETRNVIRALNEEIYTDDLLINRNVSLILLLKYIESENIESQNYLPWLNKTSFIDVAHTIRELREYEKFQRDNVDFLSGYINEVKPYHVVIKDFYLKYSGVNVYQGDITDFDLPSMYNKDNEQFITPTLKFDSTTGDAEFLPTASIWDTPEYASWYQNYGLVITGQLNTYVGKIKRQLTTVSNTILIGNTFGFPVQGLIRIDDELITYTGVNRELGILTGASRGYNGTTVSSHDYNSSVYMDIPGVVVYDTARGYVDPPIINAVIDTSIYPAPRVPARFRAVMQVDKVIGVDVLNPGEGYVVTPRLEFQSSMSIDFTNFDINYIDSTITIQSTAFVTGDCLEYSTSNFNVTGLTEHSHYYIRILTSNVIESIIALYYTKNDAMVNSNRVILFDSGNTVNAKLSMTPRAEVIMGRSGVRSIKPILKFDRTSYRPLVEEWVPGNFYGSGLNILNSSSSEMLAIAQPYEDMPKVNRGVTNAALFVVQNVLMGSYFDVTEITEPGLGYSVGDTIVVPGTDMDSTWASPGNDCTITVATVDIAGAITSVTVAGSPGLVTRSSLQGALFPILGVTSVGGQANVTLDFSISGLDSSKLKNLNLYFYNTLPPYTYDDSAAGGAVIKVYRPKFTPSKVLNEYVITIINNGAIYNAGQKITILGSVLGGVNVVNDATITITSVTSLNAIQTAFVSGVAVGGFRSYYVTPISSTTIKIFNDINMTIPTPVASFPYTVGDQGFVNDPALATSSSSYNYTNYVVYKDKIFKCVQDTNSRTFLYDQWEEVDSNLELFNALDRIVGYYQPTSDMPGKNLQGLVKGITYTNNTYYGNQFAPEDQYPLDINLKGQYFYPAYVDIRSITYDGTQYVAVGENDSNSVVLKSTNGTTWSIAIISEQPLDVRDIVYDSTAGAYVITSYNSTTPVLISFDAITWASSGPFTPYDIGGYDDDPFDRTSINLSNMQMVGDTYGNGLYVSVGNRYIITSDNGISWEKRFDFGDTTRTLNAVSYANLTAFDGFVAVGGHTSTSTGSGTITYGDIVISYDGVNWTYLTPPLTGYKLYGVAADSTYIVAVGESGVTYYTTNGSNWVTGQVLSSADFYDLVYANGLFVAVGEGGEIYTSTDGQVWTSSTSGVTDNLKGVYYNGTQYVAVGDNSTILFSPDAITWTKVGLLQQNAPFYDVQGSSFDYGYAPEEMVAGVVSDNLSMYVKSRPSGSWDYQTYQHTGFSMVSRVASPDVNNTVSFDGLVDIPATVSVFVVDPITLIGNRIYESTSVTNINYTYTVDWTNKTITLDNALTSNETILIEVYEVGGGSQLAKDSTDNVPLRINNINGFSEIHLGYKYDSQIYFTPICFLNGVKLTYISDFYLDTTSQGTTKISFNDTYVQGVDYITYTIFGNTVSTGQPEQYGFSIPETQVIVADGTATSWALDNFVYYISPLDTASQLSVNDTAIVEINGIRKTTPADLTYNITPNISAIISVSAANAFSFVIATYPDIDKVVAGSNITFGSDPTLYPITASNVDPGDSSLWTLTTTGAPSVLPGTGVVVSAIIVFDTAPSADDIVAVTTFNDTRQQALVLDTDTNFEVNQIYYINNSITPVQLVLANPIGSGAWANGTMIRIDGIEGSVQLNNNIFYVKQNTTNTYALFLDPATTTPLQSKLVSKYVRGGYAWKDSQVFTVTQPLFTEEDNNRVWVAINGERLSPSSLRYITGNGLNLLTPIISTDVITVTSMIPSATPNELVYNLTVDKNADTAVYRSNNNTSTWLTQDLLITDDTIYVNDASRMVDTLVQTIQVLNNGTSLVAPVQADYATVREVTVYNQNTLSQLNPSSYALVIINTATVIEFNSEVSLGDRVIVTLRVGEILVINSERIRFNLIDYTNNTISGLTRGIQGTGAQNVHSTYSQVFSLIPTNELFKPYYYQVWDDIVFQDITTTVTSTTPGEFKFLIATTPDIVNVKAGASIVFGTDPTAFDIATSIKDPNYPTLWIIRTTGSPAVVPGDDAVITYVYSGNPLQLSTTDPARFLKSGNI